MCTQRISIFIFIKELFIHTSHDKIRKNLSVLIDNVGDTKGNMNIYSSESFFTKTCIGIIDTHKDK